MFGFGSLFSRPDLPKECGCGDSSSDTCSQTGLRNHRHFPPFAYLPEENDIDESYYAPDEGGMYSPTRHWALVGEIVDVTFFIRPRVTIKTQYGEEVLVNFHLDEPSPSFFKWEDLKVKKTMAILYAENRTFVDMNNGVRQESAQSVMVFPASLSKLTGEFKRHAEFEQTNIKTCFECGAVETEEHKLMKCNRCKKAFYCNRDCQLSHWKCSHKSLCKHAPMLSNLAGLNFSQFNGYTDWSFPTIVPQTVEEKKEKAAKAYRESLYRMGAVVDRSMLSRFSQMMSAIEGKDLVSDKMTKDFFAHLLFDEDSLPATAGETFLFTSLKEFMTELTQDPNLRQYVVSLQTNSRSGFGASNMEHFTSDIILSALFYSMPMWQHEACIGGISWAFESHHPLNSRTYDAEGNVWHTIGDSFDSLMIKNRVSQTCAFLADDMRLVAEIGERIAVANPNDMIIRVLRATANESWSDAIRSIATKDDLPNMFTLWIREDIASCGRFNPPNPTLSVVEQLLDTRPFSLFRTMLEGLGASEEHIRWAEEESEEEENQEVETQVCSSCGRSKAKHHFSKTQLRKYGNDARCMNCVHWA